jgi:hypothetical protein
MERKTCQRPPICAVAVCSSLPLLRHVFGKPLNGMNLVMRADPPREIMCLGSKIKGCRDLPASCIPFGEFAHGPDLETGRLPGFKQFQAFFHLSYAAVFVSRF